MPASITANSLVRGARLHVDDARDERAGRPRRSRGPARSRSAARVGRTASTSADTYSLRRSARRGRRRKSPGRRRRRRIRARRPRRSQLRGQLRSERAARRSGSSRRDLRSDVDVNRRPASATGAPAIVANSSRASSSGTPNLLILRPVEMCGWLFASMSGLTRIATRATRPSRAAIASRRASSPADSTLIAFHAERHRAFELRGRLADAGEDDVGGREARLARHLDFPDRVRVGRAAQLAQQPRDRERRVRLSARSAAVRIVAERGVDRAVALAQHGGAVDVDRRAHGVGNGRQRHAVADELVLERKKRSNDWWQR